MSTTICPICEKRMDQGPAEWPSWPFCSPRCKLIDLGRWLKQDYSIPAAPAVDEDEEKGDSES